MTVFRYGGEVFFTVRARDNGSEKGNAQYMYRIDTLEYTLHPVEVVRASERYRETLPDSLFIWDDEVIRCGDGSIRSVFYVWKGSDPHHEATGGKVSAVYGVERIGAQNYRLSPREINFTPCRAQSEIPLDDSFSIRLREIPREEYTARREEAAHLQPEPYKMVTGDQARSMLAGRVRLIVVKEE